MSTRRQWHKVEGECPPDQPPVRGQSGVEVALRRHLARLTRRYKTRLIHYPSRRHADSCRNPPHHY